MTAPGRRRDRSESRMTNRFSDSTVRRGANGTTARSGNAAAVTEKGKIPATVIMIMNAASPEKNPAESRAPVSEKNLFIRGSMISASFTAAVVIKLKGTSKNLADKAFPKREKRSLSG